jgi:hypothetical protein
MTQLDPTIVELYAEHLQRRASSRIMGYTIALALLGSFLGSAPLLAPNRVLVPHSLGLALLLVGAAAGGYLGFTMGVRRAEGLQLQAQMTLHQFQVEQALIQSAAPPAVAPALPPVAVPAAAPPAAAAPVPVAAPAPAPAPVAPAPPQAPAPLPAAAVPAVAPPPPVETVLPAAPFAAPPAMPPLSAPASVPEPPASVALVPERPVAAAPVTAAPALPSVPRLVEAPRASPPAMMPPLSAER